MTAEEQQLQGGDDVENGQMCSAVETISSNSHKDFDHNKKLLTADDSFFSNRKAKGLVWRNVNMKLLAKKNTDDVKLHILKNVWGQAEAGKTTAIMGASGAGKTSLFQTLAGRVSSNGKLVVEGEIFLGGIKINPRDQEHRKLFAYVSQEDSLHHASTPREALTFSAKLRLPRDTTQLKTKVVVEKIIEELGLGSAADTVIGGGMKKGISGGEKKRVSIGIELVSSPSIIFIDEPTSGLDSFAAGQVMGLLDRVARAGNTVLFTIHQPSSEVFSKFDRLILLNKGRVMHQGDASKVSDDFERYGHPIPAHYNPADWILDVAQTQTLVDMEKSGFFNQNPADLLEGATEVGIGELVIPDKKRVSFWKEFYLLQQREMRTLRRNPTPIILNVVLTSILALIFSVIFLGVGREDRSNFSVVQSQVGALVNLLIAILMGQSNTAMLIFSSERPLFLREYSTDHYSILPYFLSKLWSEALASFAAILAQTLITFWLMGFQMGFGHFLAISYSLAMTATAVTVLLGAFFAEPSSAMAFYTLVVVPQFYFSGLFIAIELVPKWVAWAQYLCSLTYASRLGFAYEFGDNCAPGEAEDNCNTILDANSVSVDDTWWYWLALLGLFVAFRVCGVVVLRSKATY